MEGAQPRDDLYLKAKLPINVFVVYLIAILSVPENRLPRGVVTLTGDERAALSTGGEHRHRHTVDHSTPPSFTTLMACS